MFEDLDVDSENEFSFKTIYAIKGWPLVLGFRLVFLSNIFWIGFGLVLLGEIIDRI
ncbi:MAG: hypothetical protein K9H49_15835 [Bacteroidales bacterium]|nr:hypothetical protein [Bacteroidales bacterium]MCF8391260.1 hypothetical protein [Bacteroidales bacterium]